MKKQNRAEEILTESIRFVFTDTPPEQLALLIQHIKSEFKEEIANACKDFEEGAPDFIFKAILTGMLFEVLTAEYISNYMDQDNKGG